MNDDKELRSQNKQLESTDYFFYSQVENTGFTFTRMAVKEATCTMRFVSREDKSEGVLCPCDNPIECASDISGLILPHKK